MRVSIQQRLDQEHDHRIDLSPLLDVVFILLIFFIVTSVFVKETGVEIDKPQALSSNLLEQSAIMIAITENAQVIFDKSNIGVAGVRTTVYQLLQNQNDRPVVIQADKNVRTELLIQVIDEAKLAGATSVNIATDYL